MESLRQGLFDHAKAFHGAGPRELWRTLPRGRSEPPDCPPASSTGCRCPIFGHPLKSKCHLVNIGRSAVKTVRAVLATAALGVLLVASRLSGAQTKEDSSVLHPAPAAKTITVTVTELRHAKHGADKEVLIAQAAGFSNDTCDVITTFDVVKRYEERQTWTDVRQRVDIVIDGNTYPAKFREIGSYPLGLNLACIDFVSPMARAALQMPVLPLESAASGPPRGFYDDRKRGSSDPGTLFPKKKGEISFFFTATPNGPLEFASADDLRRFLK